MKALVIVESPAKARTIERFLGKDYKVKASGGHIRDLPKKRLGVKIDDNFEPTYIQIKEKKKLLDQLVKSAQKKDVVYLAPDPDREGEAIAWHLLEILKMNGSKVKRIEFNEITRNAVLKSLESPRSINMNRVNAQQARRILDRLVGYKLSPLLWKKVKKGLSAGRVQSVAVFLICEREEEINKFVPEEYWTIDAELSVDKSKTDLKAGLFKYKNKKISIKNQQESDRIVEDVKDQKFVVDKIQQRTKKRNPAPPFITSTLQQEASRKFRWSAKKTMMVAQKLYEGLDIDGEHMGLITYMRTDSTRISDDARKTGYQVIKDLYGKEYLGGHTSAKKSKSKKNVQDAHEAIRPTDATMKPEEIKDFISKDEVKLYTLIWQRFIASLMAQAEIATTTVFVSALDYLFKASGSVVKFPGFMTVYTESKDNAEEEEKQNNLPELQKGQELNLQKLLPQQHFTKPPPRYTEATLVKTLEEKGIGRPSTYAPIISTITGRGYVDKEKGKLIPTKLGMTVNKQLKNHFSAVIDVGFTARMENQLDEIVDGKINWTDVLKDFYGSFEQELKLAEKNMPKVKEPGKPTDQKCEKCGSQMLERESRYGPFLACSAFPKCRNAKPIIKKVGVPCPECGGQIIEKRTKKRKVFYGCDNYPKCNFAVWTKPVAVKCQECGGMLTEIKGDKHKCYSCGKITEKEDQD